MERKRAVKTAGFTLIELLVVIAIIMVLTSIAVVNYKRYYRDSIVASVKTELRQCLGLWAIEGGDTYSCSVLDKVTVNMYEDNDGGITVDSPITINNYSINCKIDRKQGVKADKFYVECW